VSNNDEGWSFSLEASANDRVPLLLIHGAWLTSASWENFSGYFGDRGFAVPLCSNRRA
jgi:pimeloyl-ACP methyl ester carboxylesterase